MNKRAKYYRWYLDYTIVPCPFIRIDEDGISHLYHQSGEERLNGRHGDYINMAWWVEVKSCEVKKYFKQKGVTLK